MDRDTILDKIEIALRDACDFWTDKNGSVGVYRELIPNIAHDFKQFIVTRNVADEFKMYLSPDDYAITGLIASGEYASAAFFNSWLANRLFSEYITWRVKEEKLLESSKEDLEDYLLDLESARNPKIYRIPLNKTSVEVYKER